VAAVAITKILVFDDEEDTQDLFQQKFRHQIEDGTYEFAFTTSLAKTDELLKGRPFDIFVSDINVDGVDGISLISRLKNDFPMMRSVVISAYGDINTLRAVMRGGAHDFVVKPIDFKDLADTLQKTAKVVESLKKNEAMSKKLTAISDELDVSAKLQKSILPGNVLRKGSIELYADSLPAVEIGGDFYDFFWLSETKLGIVMADVSGKNVSAAMFGLIAKTLIKSFSRMYPSPAECFKNVNVSICAENVATMFVTAMYGVVDMEQNNITYTCAGHLPLAVIAPGKESRFLECDPGMALGIFDEVEFVDQVYTFAPGESIMMYTDGVTEAPNKKGEEYDFERFGKVLTEYSKLGPSPLTQEVVKSIQAFTVGCPQADDITTLCLKYRLRVMPNVN
jgi:sigma-B regulation protein RsbU (phosphoserine phosphatase)